MANWTKTSKPGIRVRDGQDGRKQYLAEWRDHTNERISRTFPTLAEAVAAREAARTEKRRIKAGQTTAPPEAKTFDQLADHWLKVKAAKKSIGSDRSVINAHLRPHFGDQQLPTIRKSDIDDLFTDLVGTYAPDGQCIKEGRVAKKTAWNILSLLGSLLREAKKQEWIASIPHIERPRVGQQDFVWIDLEQIERLIQAAREDILHPQLPVIIAVAAYAGLRAGEVMGLRWDDVDLDGRRISVRRSFDAADDRVETSTKSGNVRHVPLLGHLEPILREWRECGTETPWLFPSDSGQPRQQADRHLQEHLHAALERAEIDAAAVHGTRKNAGLKRKRRFFTFHDLRHSFASNWMREGGDIFQLSKVLGHSSVTITMRYAHLAPDAYDGVRVMGGMGQDEKKEAQGDEEQLRENETLREEVDKLRAEVQRLQDETQRQKKMLDRLLEG